MSNGITKEMTFGDLIKKYPKSGPILAGYGLHCIGCHIAVIETLEQGARAHGLSDDQIQSMVTELNQLAV